LVASARPIAAVIAKVRTPAIAPWAVDGIASTKPRKSQPLPAPTTVPSTAASAIVQLAFFARPSAKWLVPAATTPTIAPTANAAIASSSELGMKAMR
jgi:hypothetical protein